MNESLLFAVALAVGLSPELLPAIVSLTLSAGARAMGRRGVIVRRLEAIENLGSMEWMCRHLGICVVRCRAECHPCGSRVDSRSRRGQRSPRRQPGLRLLIDDSGRSRVNWSTVRDSWRSSGQRLPRDRRAAVTLDRPSASLNLPGRQKWQPPYPVFAQSTR